jgi:carbamoyl-phosphate synthase large subunit
MISAGFKLYDHTDSAAKGVFITVSDSDKFEIVQLAKKLDELGMKIYATKGTAREIAGLGIDVTVVRNLSKTNEIMDLLEGEKLNYIVYTGIGQKKSIEDFVRLHRRATQLGVACLTSLDTANALADIIASRYTEHNTELVDINSMRTEKNPLTFYKMQGTGNDYILIDNSDGVITCPESLTLMYTDRHYGIGADGLVLVENSDIADAKMRMFNIDGTEGKMAGNCIRLVAKYLYDSGKVVKEDMTLETASGIKEVTVYTSNDKVTSVCAKMGKADFNAKNVPVAVKEEKVLDHKATFDGTDYSISCVSVGNPHCVIFCDKVDAIDVQTLGPKVEYNKMFPERINTEFVRVVNRNTLKMRVWERGNGETFACGTGACAAVAVACELGLCDKGADITVKVKGGDLIVNYTDDGITLTGNAKLVYKGELMF